MWQLQPDLASERVWKSPDSGGVLLGVTAAVGGLEPGGAQNRRFQRIGDFPQADEDRAILGRPVASEFDVPKSAATIEARDGDVVNRGNERDALIEAKPAHSK